jgi:hypothetical protein
MKKIILICTVALFIALGVIILSGTHGDGFAHPTINITIVDNENNPVQNASIFFFERMFDQDYEANKKKFLNGLQKRGMYRFTNTQGAAEFIARFGIAVYYFDIWNKQLFPHTVIFDDGVIIISKEDYKTKKVFLDKERYREKILNKDTIELKVILEK